MSPPKTGPDPGPPPPFLEIDPPHWAAQGLSYLLILLFTAVVLGAALIELPETLSSPFVLAPVQGADPIRAARGGTLSELRVVEGQPVRKSDTLAVIRSPAVGDRSSELLTSEAQLEGLGLRLANLQKKHQSQQLRDEEEARRLKGRQAFLARAVELAKKRLALKKGLAEDYVKLNLQGVTRKEESVARQLEAYQTALDLEQLQAEQEEARSALEKLRYEAEASQAEFRELERGLQEETGKTRIRIGILQEELATSTGSELSVAAPCDGAVLRLRVNGPGAVVQPGDVLCEMSCAGEKLQAELSVPQVGVSRIQPGQRAKLLYDAFPYQRYGVLLGTVRWISPASVLADGQPVFRVLVDLDEDAIRVEGRLRPLLPGMGGRAQLLLGRRSLLSYAFEPIQRLREDFTAPPAR